MNVVESLEIKNIVYSDDLPKGETICVGDLIIRSASDRYIEEQEGEVF
ncbi:hypothetical protein MKX72_20365 [Priestia sp. FSL R5-0597]